VTWNPKEKTLISAALSLQDQEYFISRAIEMLTAAKESPQKESQLISAIRLLVAALNDEDRAAGITSEERANLSRTLTGPGCPEALPHTTRSFRAFEGDPFHISIG
jgi:hypothetical protein